MGGALQTCPPLASIPPGVLWSMTRGAEEPPSQAQPKSQTCKTVSFNRMAGVGTRVCYAAVVPGTQGRQSVKAQTQTKALSLSPQHAGKRGHLGASATSPAIGGHVQVTRQCHWGSHEATTRQHRGPERDPTPGGRNPKKRPSMALTCHPCLAAPTLGGSLPLGSMSGDPQVFSRTA